MIISWTWLLLATGFAGGLSFVFVVRWLRHWLFTPPSVAAYFSPEGGCAAAVVREIQHARKQILVLAYSFSSKPIAQALIDAKKRGVHVEILLDHSNEQEAYSDLPQFLEHGLAPVIDAKHAIAHNKVMIIDRRVLVTGSFNFTHQAETANAENLLVLKGHPGLVELYYQNFEAHKAHCQTPHVKAPQPAAHKAA
jgi:phosphatidylserine/phosphatidylglycerophosphate/cardiolipin synthase-like enzyme